MKKILCLVLVLTLGVLTLAGCGGSKETPATEAQANEQQGGNGAQGGEAQAPAAEGFVFSYNGTQIPMTAEAAPVLEALGEAKSVQETASCAFEGMDKQYFYGSFYVTAGSYNGKDVFTALWFADDSVSTAEGLCIGDSKEKAEQLYGADGFNGTNAYIYEDDTTNLTIIITDDAVSSIQYTGKF
ncbi:MAG: hypothetical protein HUJ75_04670 [Parasporobacterium sp.]|nr:hypothetical protein [Parasporobacterium sp.]